MLSIGNLLFGICYLLLAVWLLHRQLGVTIDGKISLTRCWSLCFATEFWPEVHQEPRDEIESLTSAERAIGFEQWKSWFYCNALTHWATLPWVSLTSLVVSNAVSIKIIITTIYIKKQFFHNRFQNLVLFDYKRVLPLGTHKTLVNINAYPPSLVTCLFQEITPQSLNVSAPHNHLIYYTRQYICSILMTQRFCWNWKYSYLLSISCDLFPRKY